MLDLQERIRKHGFEGGPGLNKDRWVYNGNIFNIDTKVTKTTEEED